MDGQMTLEMFERKETKIDFECFSSRKGKHVNSIILGRCPHDGEEKWRKKSCEECDAFIEFYGAARIFRELGYKWNQSVELAKVIHGIESAYGYTLDGVDIEEAKRRYEEAKNEGSD